MAFTQLVCFIIEKIKKIYAKSSWKLGWAKSFNLLDNFSPIWNFSDFGK